MVKNLPVKAGDSGDRDLIPGLGKSPGGEHGNPLQYSCLENPMDRGAWWATVHGVTKSRTRLRTEHAHTFISLTLIKHRITRENQITKNSSNLRAAVTRSTAEADNCSFSTTRKACECSPPKINRLMFSSLPCLHFSC